jgi:alkyl hydroperoxide reductase subunit D
MTGLDTVRGAIPEVAKDIKVNLQSVLQGGALSPAQRWGVAIAASVASRNPALREAVLADARREVDEAVVEDALAAAVLMAMNNVYYRFRHMVGKPSYAAKPARLRMMRLAKPAAEKLDFELFALAVSAINACETCIQAHEKVVVDGGLTEDHVNDAVRIAATIHAAAVALEIQPPAMPTGASNVQESQPSA